MPVSKKQQEAACAELGRRKRGEKPRNFKNMSDAKLAEWCKAKKLEKK